MSELQKTAESARVDFLISINKKKWDMDYWRLALVVAGATEEQATRILRTIRRPR